MQERYLVEHVGEPLALLFPVEIKSPQNIIQRFRTHCHFRREGLFGKPLERSAYLEIFRYVIFPVQPEHCLALHAIVCVTFKTYIYRRSGIDDALVEYRHLTGRVVDGVVGTFREHHSTGRHHHRSLRNIIRPERNHVCRRSFVLSHQHVFVFLRYLSRSCLSGVIQFRKRIFVCRGGRDSSTYKICAQITSERFGCRKEHTAVAHRISFYKVEVSV